MVSGDPPAVSSALQTITGLFRMSDSNGESPQRYLRTSEAARHVTLSPRTLEKHRIYGTGPEYSKIGGRVVYKEEDLDAWVKLGKKKSTSDPGTSTVLPAKRHAPIPYAGKERR